MCFTLTSSVNHILITRDQNAPCRGFFLGKLKASYPESFLFRRSLRLVRIQAATKPPESTCQRAWRPGAPAGSAWSSSQHRPEPWPPRPRSPWPPPPPGSPFCSSSCLWPGRWPCGAESSLRWTASARNGNCFPKNCAWGSYWTVPSGPGAVCSGDTKGPSATSAKGGVPTTRPLKMTAPWENGIQNGNFQPLQFIQTKATAAHSMFAQCHARLIHLTSWGRRPSRSFLPGGDQGGRKSFHS